MCIYFARNWVFRYENILRYLNNKFSMHFIPCRHNTLDKLKFCFSWKRRFISIIVEMYPLFNIFIISLFLMWIHPYIGTTMWIYDFMALHTLV